MATLAGSASVGTKQPKSLCSPVLEFFSVLGILQPDTNSLLCAAKVQGEALFRSRFIMRCQPEVLPCPVTGRTIVCQGEDGASWELSAMFASRALKTGARNNLWLLAFITTCKILSARSLLFVDGPSSFDQHKGDHHRLPVYLLQCKDW